MFQFSFRSLKAKLLLLVIFAFACAASLAGYSLYAVRSLAESSKQLATRRLPLARAIAEVRTGNQGAVRYLWLAAAYPAGSEDREEALDTMTSYFSKIKTGMSQIEPLLETDATRKSFENIKVLIEQVSRVVAENKSLLNEGTHDADEKAKVARLQKMPPVAKRFSQEVEDLNESIDRRNAEINAHAQALGDTCTRTLIAVCLTSGFLLLLIGYTFASNLAKRLAAITESVSQAGVQVSAASEQLSTSSEQLSHSSQEQASAIEETSAALTEISGMVEANTKGAEQARDYAKEVQAISEQTQKSMAELSNAMNLILDSNVRIEKIVKVIQEIGDKTEVIDEIVFKTQLLSFNASVEAERAGEHGRGFAVVAQEVGNLAQMSGKAATEIATIVRESIKEAEQISVENKDRVNRGTVLAASTQEKMGSVIQKVSLILESNSRIAAASQEQNQGVSQITTSVDGLNQTTQENASTAEEAASASQELASQSISLMGLVNELRNLVTGNASAPSQTVGIAPREMATITPITRAAPANFSAKRAPVMRSPLKAAYGSSPIVSSSSDDDWEKL